MSSNNNDQNFEDDNDDEFDFYQLVLYVRVDAC